MAAKPLTTSFGPRPRVYGLGQFQAEMATLSKLVQGHAMDYKTLRDAIKDQTGYLLAQRRIKMATRTAYRMEHAAMFETMRAMGDLIRIGSTVTSMYNTYTNMMTRVELQQDRVSESATSIAEITASRTQLLREFSTESYYVLQADKDLAKAEESHAKDLEQLTRIRNQNNMAMVGMSLQLLQLPRQLWYLQYHLRVTRDYLNQSGGAAEYLSASLGGVTMLAPALGAILGGLAGYTAVKTMRDIIPDKYIDWEEPRGPPPVSGYGGFKLYEYIGDLITEIKNRPQHITIQQDNVFQGGSDEDYMRIKNQIMQDIENGLRENE